MKICFVKYPGKATLVEPSVAVVEQLQEEEEAEDEDKGDDYHRDHYHRRRQLVDCKVVNDDNNNHVNGDEVVCEEPLPANDMNSYEASWQECRLKWCLRSRSKERHNMASGWTESGVGDDDDDNCSDGGRSSAAVAGRRNPPEKRQACSSDSTGSSQEEQDAAAFAAASYHRPKAKPLSRVQSVRHDTASHRYRTRQRVAAEMLDEQRAVEAARDLCRSSAAKIKKSLSFRNPAPKKVATGGDRLLRPVSDDDYYYNNNNNNNINNNSSSSSNRQHHHYSRHHDNISNHHYHLHSHEDQLQQQEQLIAVTTAASGAVVPSVIAADSGSGQDNFAIPRPKLIVPVHTYGLRKRRTGNTISSNRTASDVHVTSASSTIASSSSGSSSNNAESKKHHNSCPGKNSIIHV